MPQNPSVGRIVHVVGDTVKSNGTDVAPGIITRVWDEHPDGGWTVNVTAFPDAGVPKLASSTRLFETEDEARRYSQGPPSSDMRATTAAFWPPRV